MRTPLYAQHQAEGARIVDFHGWDMPIQYAGILDEHMSVRTGAGLFDLSHMGRVWIRGKDRKAYLNRMLTIDVAKMPHGRCRYTFLLTEQGTIIDDLLVYEDSKTDASLLVVNASNREKDVAWLKRHAAGADVAFDDQTASTALLAVQGPKSLDVVRKTLGHDPGALKYYTFDSYGGWMISRTGYTGEDGFEIFVPAEKAAETWTALRKGAAPIGLGARDTLRTEAAMALYGNDIDDTTTPIEADIEFGLVMDKVDFIGKAALAAQKAAGIKRRRVGFEVGTPRTPRRHQRILDGDRAVGEVTSGMFSAILKKSIGMAYVPIELAAPGTKLAVELKPGRTEPITVVPLPFYKRKK